MGKLALALEVLLENIYEADETMTFMYRDQSYGNSGNHYYSIPEFMLDHQKKYIEKLEQENTELKDIISKLQQK